MKRVMISCLFIIISPFLFSQTFPSKNYPQHYFRNPLNVPISLAGNFGEIRPNHYHMGLDIRTEKRTNLPVYAAADGYIAKVKVDATGFGQAIYINHLNGYTTLYAHLNDFFPALSKYIKQQQYKLESWQVFLDIPPNLFPVKKGDWIAYSGSTGGSEAPHVHFEIRKTDEDVNLNPTLFGLPISDNTSPVILKLAVYDASKSIYEQLPKIFAVKKIKGVFTIPGGIITTGCDKVGFAISAFDTESGTSNHNGIYQATLYNNDHAEIGFEMDNISYSNTRNVNAHIDYKTKSLKGSTFQELFRLPGYVNSIYYARQNDGVIDIRDGSVHKMKIEVKDGYGNSSLLSFSLKYKPATMSGIQASGKIFYPQMLDGEENPECAFYIGEKCLYDSVHIGYIKSNAVLANAVSAVHSIGETYIPLQDSFLVRIKPAVNFDMNKKDKVVMQRFAGTKSDVSAVQWQGGWASAKFRDFGNFQLLMDEEPPKIIPIGFVNGSNLSKAVRIVLIVKDNLGVFKNFRAELDGKWLRFTNDKGKSFIYVFDEHCPPGNHELKITVRDEAGNTAENVYHFTR
ncbi:MAG TPA: peptidoglycan DD-metalloendopeptidase family protein [Puia sp.]|nr:peptidoglycan DD-metalloendopeptidase family protein [Puia sp.]